MPHDEFIMWTEYYLRYNPEGWREDLRTYYLLQSQGEKRKPHQIFPALKRLLDTEKANDPVETLKGSKLHQLMLNAANGDKLDFL
jgi:hypothetical protein